MAKKRWIKKREFMVYYLIYKEYGCNRDININELIELIMSKLFFNRKTSVNILKRLVKMGFLSRGYEMTVSPKCLEQLLDEYLQQYIDTRRKNVMKSGRSSG